MANVEPPNVAAAFAALAHEAEEADQVDPYRTWSRARPDEKARALAEAARFRTAVARQEAELHRPLTAEEEEQLRVITGKAPPPPSVKTDAYPVMDWAALTAVQPEPPPTLRPGLAKVGVTLLAGSPKVGKTLLAGQWALETGVRTLMIIEEGGLPGLVYRLTRQASALGIENPPIKFIHRRRVRLDDRKSVRMVRDVIDPFRPGLVIFDPLNRLHASDENKPMAMTAVMDNLSAIAADFRCAVLTIHHLAKPSTERKGDVWDRFRGASSIRSATDGNLALDGSSSDKVRLVGEFRDAEPLLEHLELDRETLLFGSGREDDDDEPTGTLADRIEVVLAQGHASVEQIADEIGEDRTKVRVILNRYKHRFSRLPSGKWELLPEGFDGA